MATSFAYIHCRPDGTPFYVGKGALRRAKYLGERNDHHKAVVKKYGRENIFIGLLDCSSGEIAYDLEAGIIKCVKRMGITLTNKTAGGDGGNNPCDETRKKLSLAAKKRGISQACREALIRAKKGKALSAEQKARQSASRKGIVFSDEHRKNISIAAKKRGMSQEILEKAHAASRGRVQSTEEKIKRGKAIKLAWAAKKNKLEIV
jgi:hypothetical protein